jgi:hypothetical protein
MSSGQQSEHHICCKVSIQTDRSASDRLVSNQVIKSAIDYLLWQHPVIRSTFGLKSQRFFGHQVRNQIIRPPIRQLLLAVASDTHQFPLFKGTNAGSSQTIWTLFRFQVFETFKKH